MFLAFCSPGCSSQDGESDTSESNWWSAECAVPSIATDMYTFRGVIRFKTLAHSGAVEIRPFSQARCFFFPTFLPSFIWIPKFQRILFHPLPSLCNRSVSRRIDSLENRDFIWRLSQEEVPQRSLGHFPFDCGLQKWCHGTSLVVQWLRLCTLNAGGPGFPSLVRKLDPACCNEGPVQPN